jgi:hypothetical protein
MDRGLVMHSLRCEADPDRHTWASTQRDTRCPFCDSPARVVVEPLPTRDSIRTNFGRTVHGKDAA